MIRFADGRGVADEEIDHGVVVADAHESRVPGAGSRGIGGRFYFGLDCAYSAATRFARPRNGWGSVPECTGRMQIAK